MYKIINLLLFGILIIVLTGCPYESKYSLVDSRNLNIDSLLIGNWILINFNENSSDSIELNILKFNSTEYIIIFKESNNETTYLRAFSILIDNKKIVNLIELKEKSKFIFLKYEIAGNILKVAYVSNEAINNDFDSQESFYDFFLRNLNKKDFFEPEIIFRKKK